MSDMTASTIDFSTTGNFTTYGYAALDYTPMRSGLVVWANPASFTISNINDTFSNYDLIVYTGGYNAAAGRNQGAISNGTTTYYYTVPNPFTTSLIQSTDTDIADGVDDATYVVFNNLTANTVNISITTVNGGCGAGGFQIVEKFHPGDLSGNGKVTLEDIAKLAAQWQNGYYMDTLLKIANNWLYGTSP